MYPLEPSVPAHLPAIQENPVTLNDLIDISLSANIVNF